MIKIYNRNTSSYDEELVAGKKYIDWVYESPVGKQLTELFVKKKLFSKVYGMYCDSKASKSKINAFIKDFNIDMNECLESSENFKCFNDFFIRELKPEARPIDFNECSLISPGDGRLSVHSNIDVNNLVQIKNITYSFSELINDDTLASKYDKGYCLILRLAPIDYHRFHFIDSGIPSKTTKIKGFYYSVNPTALDNIPKLFCQNKREYSILESDNFGDVLIMEVGATCVGSIIQTYIPNSPVKRGDEKGYFKFGGSTVVMFFEPNKIRIDDDILTQSELGFESKVLFGERIGYKI